jgi:hypothetical protein
LALTDRDKIIDLPEGVEQVQSVPESVKQMLVTGQRPCGEGRFAWEWNKGPARGQPISVYCAEPLCLQTGECTGPRFVPHMTQENSRGKPRKITAGEAVLAARVGAQMAREQTGRPDTRTDQAVANHIAETWRKAKAAVKGGRFS